MTHMWYCRGMLWVLSEYCLSIVWEWSDVHIYLGNTQTIPVQYPGHYPTIYLLFRYHSATICPIN